MKRKFGFRRIGRRLHFRGSDPASRLAYALVGFGFIAACTALIFFTWPSDTALPRNNPLITLVTEEQEAVLMMSLFFFGLALLILYLKATRK